jgi:hypothetical protein
MNTEQSRTERVARIKGVFANARRRDESFEDWQKRTEGKWVRTETGYRLTEDR